MKSPASQKFAETEAVFLWRKLKPDEANLAYQLHLAANADTPPGLVRQDDLAHFVTNVQNQGRILACFLNDNKMVAYGILGLGPSSNIKLITLLGLRDEDLPNFATLDGVAALAPWRGNRLHRESIQARLEMAREQQRRYVGATVSPDNINSLRGLLEAGFHIRNFSYLYGGLARLVMLCDLHAPPLYWNYCRQVVASDQAGHQAAIDKGWIGYALTETTSGVFHVLYGVQQVT